MILCVWYVQVLATVGGAAVVIMGFLGSLMAWELVKSWRRGDV